MTIPGREIVAALFLFALSACVLAGAQPSPETTFRGKIRRELSDQHVAPLSPSAPTEPPKHERVLELGRQAGYDRVRMQQLLLELAEEGLLGAVSADTSPSEESAQARETPKAWAARSLAAGALSALRYIADHSALERLISLAEASPPALESSATRAVAYVVCREAPDRLPMVARQLTANQTSSRLYPMLHDVLKYLPPSDERERARLTSLIVEVFKEGFNNPNYDNRIYLDGVLEEYSPAFRNSDERKRILTELSASSNPIVQRYAEGKLQALRTAEVDKPERAVAVSPPVDKPPSVATSKPVESASVETVPLAAPSFVVAGLLAVAGLLWLLWRVASRH